MKKILLSALALSVLMLTNCKKDEDTEAPKFAVVASPSNQGSDVIKLRGENMQIVSVTSDHSDISGTVTDNDELKELKIDVHNANDGHTHGKSAGEYEYLDFEKVIDISGSDSYNFDLHDLDHDPSDNIIAGVYDVILNATDQSGNETSFANEGTVKRQLYLKRAYQPLVQLNADTDNSTVDELDVEPGEALSIDGYIEEKRAGRDLAVTFIRIEIEEDHDHDHDHDDNGEGKPWDVYWGSSTYATNSSGNNLSGETLPSFSGNQLTFSDLLSTVDNYIGDENQNHYILRVTVEDEAGNLTLREFELHIH